MKKITLLTKASLVDLKFEYLTTILKQRLAKDIFKKSDLFNLSIIITKDNRSMPIIKLYNCKIENIEGLVKLILFHLETFDPDMRFDLIKLGYKSSAMPHPHPLAPRS